MEPLLRCDHVWVQFGGLRALHDLTLTVREGELVGVIGPNGSGKTTLLNAITGRARLAGGAISFKGTRLDGLRPYQISRLGVARTFQIVQPLRDMTVLENVLVSALYATGCRDVRQARRIAGEKLELVGLDGSSSRRAGEMTLPDRKKLELAQALVRQPKLLLLDEVNAGLGPREIETVMSLIREMSRGGITILVIEHVMRVIIGVCERVVVLHHGEVITDEPCGTVTRNPRVIQAYLGTRFAERWGAGQGSRG